MSQPNAEVVSAILDGEVDRFAEIVRRFDRRVRNEAARHTSDSATIEDVVQETFYRAFVNLRDLQDPDQIEGWLAVIARNCAADHFRKKARRTKNEVDCCRLQISTRQPEQGNGIEADWIWPEVDRLPGDFADLIRLRYQSAMTLAEIAAKTGLPVSTVRGRIFEARKILRQRLDQKGLLR